MKKMFILSRSTLKKMQPCPPFLWLVLDACLFFFYHVTSDYNILFQDVMLGHWGRAVTVLYDLRLLKSFSFLIAAFTTQTSAAVTHSGLPYFQGVFSFCIMHTLQLLKAVTGEAQGSWVRLGPGE